MIRRSLTDLITPDDTTRRFTPLGLSMSHMLTTEGSVAYIQDLVSVYDLAANVPDDVQKVFERLRTVHTYGVLEYDLFTVADTLAWLTFEGALRARFMDAYQGAIPFRSSTARETVPVTTFDDVFQLVRHGTYTRRKGWTLRTTDGNGDHGGFDASFPALLRWARAEGALAGQRSRSIESKAIKRLRDHAAHPERYVRTTPIESSRTIDDVAEFINRLWGHRTPGGHLYPAPMERVPLVVARTHDGGTATCLLPDQLLRGRDSEWATVRPLSEDGSWHFTLVLCPRGLDILTYALHGFESAPFPIEVLCGPDSRAATAAAWISHADAWSGDSVETVDRVFIVHYPVGSDGPAWPLELSRARSRPFTDFSGACLVVVADLPYDAMQHARAISQAGHSTSGICDDCRVTAHGMFTSAGAAIAAASRIAS